MSFAIVPIIPPPLNVAAFQAAVERGLDQAAIEAQSDFERTAATWDNPPDFAVSVAPYLRTIGTSEQIYAMLNKGTRPHTIAAHGRALVFQVPFSAKTAPRVIGSSSGSRGGQTVYTREVAHPGTTARAWDQAIAERIQGIIAAIVQKELVGALTS